MNRLLYVLFFMLVSNFIYSQDVWIEYTDSTTNLPDNKFTCVLEDASGDIWAGSGLYGLYKFENNDWTRFTLQNSGIISNFIQDMILDDSGKKWIATSYGISIYNDFNFSNYSSSNSALSADRVIQLGINSVADIYVSSLDANLDGTGIDIYNSSNFSDAASVYPTDILEARIHDWSFDSNDKLWIGSNEGITTLDNDTFHVYTYADLGTYSAFYNMICSGPYVFASSYNSLLKFDGTDWSTIDYAVVGLNSGDRIEEMMLEGNFLWIATDNQLVKFNIGTNAIAKKYDSTNSPVADYKITKMIKSNTGDYWFSAHDAIFRLIPEEEPSSLNHLVESNIKVISNDNYASYQVILETIQTDVQVEILNAMGQIFSSKSYDNVQQINLVDLPSSGIYFVNISYGNQKESFNIFIK